METQCHHLTMTQLNELLKLLQRFGKLFDGKLSNWKTDPVEFQLKMMQIQYSRDIPSTKGTLGNVKKLGSSFSPIRIPRGIK